MGTRDFELELQIKYGSYNSPRSRINYTSHIHVMMKIEEK